MSRIVAMCCLSETFPPTEGVNLALWPHPILIYPGNEEQINFSRKSPKMLKMASESFIHALLLFLGLFLKISRWLPLTPSRTQAYCT